jgi:hypothetical protein
MICIYYYRNVVFVGELITKEDLTTGIKDVYQVFMLSTPDGIGISVMKVGDIVFSEEGYEGVIAALANTSPYYTEYMKVKTGISLVPGNSLGGLKRTH